MTSSLDALVVLQDHDVAIKQLKRRLAELPERLAAHDLNERRHAVEARLQRLQAELDELASTEEEVERDLATVEQRASSLDATLRSPGSATRDAQAIIHEVDQLRERAGDLEQRGLELLEERDRLLGDQKSGQAELDAIADDAPVVLAALSAAERDGSAAVTEAEAVRAAIAADVEPALLATYDRLRERLDGVAVARVVSGACTGCHLALSAQDLDRIGKLGPGEHATCEQCGRILVP